MRGSDTVEIYVHAPLERVAGALPPSLATGTGTLVAEGGWHTAPWSRSLHGWRREARWDRGRTSDRATVDLVPANAAWTLMLVTLTAARRRVTGRDDAAVLAGMLRDLAEGRRAVPGNVVSPRHGAVGVPVTAPPAAPSVRYSAP